MEAMISVIGFGVVLNLVLLTLLKGSLNTMQEEREEEKTALDRQLLVIHDYFETLAKRYEVTTSDIKNMIEASLENTTMRLDGLGKVVQENRSKLMNLTESIMVAKKVNVERSNQSLERFKYLSRGQEEVHKTLADHLKKVEKLIGEMLPGMEGKPLTPENIAQAVKELEETQEFDAKKALDELNAFASGSNY